ncbi:MAG: hypothetical protein EHM13_00645 [Acidobacteria bacterium]|nr:MAG: hypothetical protein EHM13_00645 [Acidobacteriota bacterium]
MVNVRPVDRTSPEDVRRFIDLPFRLYAGNPCWVPPLRRDVKLWLDPAKHPFYERSEAAFHLAERDGRVVGRIAVLENKPFNAHHGKGEADFYCFECENDPEASAALFDAAATWARQRGLTRLVGPKGFSAFDGYGILVLGFEQPPVMTMTNYNLDYYAALVEAAGFCKEVDFVSFHLHEDTFVMPERVRRVAERAAARSGLRVFSYPTKRALIKAAPAIREAYNSAFRDNWEYYPLSEREVKLLVEQLALIVDPAFVKFIFDGERMVGFLFSFPDLSRAFRKARGRLTPLAIVRLLLEMRRSESVAINGAGILPEYQNRGGNALLYIEIERTIRESRFREATLVQVAETAVQMRRDLEGLGALPVKTHRIYARDI